MEPPHTRTSHYNSNSKSSSGALACPQPSFGETFLLRFTLIWSTRVGSLKSSNRNAARRFPLLLVRFTSPCHESNAGHTIKRRKTFRVHTKRGFVTDFETLAKAKGANYVDTWTLGVMVSHVRGSSTINCCRGSQRETST